MITLLLIFPPNDDSFKNLRPVYKILPPPTGLAILASYISKFHKNIEITVIDGNNQSMDEIISQGSADYIGISNWYSNHLNTLRIAKEAKRKNSKTKIVFGGPNATNLAERLINNYEYIDYIVAGDGEESLLKIVSNTKNNEIPNLWYRDNGIVQFTFSKKTKLNELAPFDFDKVTNFNPHNYYYKKKEDSLRDVSPIPISSIRGCIKAVKEKPCEFCALPSLGSLKVMSPNKFWGQIVYLNKKYGFTHFFETGDDFIVGDYPQRLLESKPNGLEVKIRVYANPDHLDSHKLETLYKLGIYEIFIGIESVNKIVLKNANKNIAINKLHEIFTTSANYNINIFPSFILGLPAETRESLLDTAHYIEFILNNYDNVKHILISAAVPIIGSTWFNNLQNDISIRTKYTERTGDDLLKTDLINYKVLLDLSLKKYSNVSYEMVSNQINQIVNIKTDAQIASYGCLEK